MLTGCRTNRKTVEWDRIFYNNEVGNDNWSFSRVELKLYENLQDTSYSHLTYIGNNNIDVDNISIKFYIIDNDSEDTNIEIFTTTIDFTHISKPNYLEHLEKGKIVGISGSTLTEIDKIIVEITYEKDGEVKNDLFEVEMKEL